MNCLGVYVRCEFSWAISTSVSQSRNSLNRVCFQSEISKPFGHLCPRLESRWVVCGMCSRECLWDVQCSIFWVTWGICVQCMRFWKHLGACVQRMRSLRVWAVCVWGITSQLFGGMSQGVRSPSSLGTEDQWVKVPSCLRGSIPGCEICVMFANLSSRKFSDAFGVWFPAWGLSALWESVFQFQCSL